MASNLNISHVYCTFPTLQNADLSGDYAKYNNRIHRNPAFQDIIKKNANDVQSICFLCLLYISYIADLS